MYKKFCLLLLIAVGPCCVSDVTAQGRNRNNRNYNRQRPMAMQYRPSSQQYQHTTVLKQTTESQPKVSENPLQAWAEEEARMMASRGTCGHIRSAPSGCFVGVGCGTTCMGSGRLVAEASYQGKTVRVWQR